MVDAHALPGVSSSGRASNLGLDLVRRDEVRVPGQRLLRHVDHRQKGYSPKRISGQHEALAGDSATDLPAKQAGCSH